MKALFILFMTDYFLTYIGIQKQIIEEANPLMVWLFELPFIPSLLARLALFFLFAYIPITLIKKHPDKIRPFIGKLYYWGAFAGNIGIMFAHLYWIIYYMRYTAI